MILINEELALKLNQELGLNASYSKDLKRILVKLNEQDDILIFKGIRYASDTFTKLWMMFDGSNVQGRNDSKDYSDYRKTTILNSDEASFEEFVKELCKIISFVRGLRFRLFTQTPAGETVLFNYYFNKM